MFTEESIDFEFKIKHQSVFTKNNIANDLEDKESKLMRQESKKIKMRKDSIVNFIKKQEIIKKCKTLRFDFREKIKDRFERANSVIDTKKNFVKTQDYMNNDAFKKILFIKKKNYLVKPPENLFINKNIIEPSKSKKRKKGNS